MRILFTLLLTALLITGFGGCYRCNQEPYFDIRGMEVKAYSLNGAVSENIAFSYDSLRIAAGFFGHTYATILNSQPLFLPSAVASEDCDPNGSSGSKETIESIAFITLTNYDSEYSAGDTLNDIINISSLSVLGTWIEKTNLREYLNHIKPGICDCGFTFYLDRKPTEKVVQFRVAVNLTNGEKYSGETIPITIKQ